MPSFVFFDSSTTAQTLADGEFGYIGEAGALEVDGTAVAATGNVLVAVDGLLSGTSSAINHFNGAFVLNVGALGRVRGNSDDAVVANGVVGASVSNAGRIVSGNDAVDVRGAGPISIINNGVLVGESDGIVTESSDSLARIVNNGTIDGFDGGIDITGGNSLLINRGEIREGQSYGFLGDADNDDIRNSGSIRGGVQTGGDDDFVINRGFIDTVNLGVGDDTYVARGTGRADRVDGRDGEDRFLGGRADDVFAGGTGPDFFRFERRGGDDTILDFAGQDRIDLSTFGFERFGQLRRQIEDRPNGSLIDLSDDGLTIFLEGVDRADLRASDFFLFPVLM